MSVATAGPRRSRGIRGRGSAADAGLWSDYETFAKIHKCRDRQGLTIVGPPGRWACVRTRWR
jgi:hypothetical protein